MTTSGYDAFISYRRSDGSAVARWLRRELNGLRLPPTLRADYGRRLDVYLDTAYERATTDFYAETIRPALLSSRFLIVVATPHAAERRAAEDWIDREIADFLAASGGRNLIVVRGAGEFDGALPGGLSKRFPNIEVVDLRGASLFAASNPAVAGRLSSEKLKIVATLLGIPARSMPLLRREQERSQQVRWGMAAGAAMAIFFSVSLLSVLALQSRDRAVRALDDGAAASGFLAMKAARLPREPGVADARRFLVNQACDLLDKFSAAGGGKSGVEEMVTCHLERASEHLLQNERSEAMRLIQDAIGIAADGYRRSPTSDRLESLLEARQRLLTLRLDLGERSLAREQLALMTGSAQNASLTSMARRYTSGAYQAIAGVAEPLEAADYYARAAYHLEAVVAESVRKGLPTSVEDITALAQLYEEQGRVLVEGGNALAAIQQLVRAVVVRSRGDPPASQWPPGSEYGAASALQRLLKLMDSSDRYVGARAQTAIVEALDSIRSSPAISDTFKQDGAKLRAWSSPPGPTGGR